MRNVATTKLWPPERRDQYLLAQSVEVPVSLDQGVLPEVSPNDPASEVLELIGVVYPRVGLKVFDDWLRFRTGDAIPTTSDEWFQFGFDVCGSFSVSALMNCGYSEGERQLLAPVWRLMLNRFHLFEEHHHAERFATIADSLIKEHAPFVPIRLFGRVP
jgi:hypothetical protein